MGFSLESNGVHMLIATYSMLVPALCIIIYDRLPNKEQKSGESWQFNYITYIIYYYIYYVLMYFI